ncbi:sulfur carrier protein ThiS [Paenibacillus cookii]|uniref:Thiamine biosynthesis protein ThiS n=1 Tax=Paenibacillus cookii TaxID=157839 RepID=A0ABQ4LR28_9BACL|nr:thiamine biosynthesis protein ThiS [Paenibacillus cookii]
MLDLIVNGEAVQVPESVATVSRLLEHFGLDRQVVVVEINRAVLGKNEHADTAVRNGDRIELVHFVGGG